MAAKPRQAVDLRVAGRKDGLIPGVASSSHPMKNAEHPADIPSRILSAAALIRSAKYLTAFTGAGIRPARTRSH